ncbi:hypothetical protein [Streptomyces canus]|nr:hypothetical protein [Streptomyces canus]MDQ1072548.1 hypothetical protein [Streptomyces canus]
MTTPSCTSTAHAATCTTHYISSSPNVYLSGPGKSTIEGSAITAERGSM